MSAAHPPPTLTPKNTHTKRKYNMFRGRFNFIWHQDQAVFGAGWGATASLSKVGGGLLPKAPKYVEGFRVEDLGLRSESLGLRVRGKAFWSIFRVGGHSSIFTCC